MRCISVALRDKYEVLFTGVNWEKLSLYKTTVVKPNILQNKNNVYYAYIPFVKHRTSERNKIWSPIINVSHSCSYFAQMRKHLRVTTSYQDFRVMLKFLHSENDTTSKYHKNRNRQPITETIEQTTHNIENPSKPTLLIDFDGNAVKSWSPTTTSDRSRVLHYRI